MAQDNKICCPNCGIIIKTTSSKLKQYCPRCHSLVFTPALSPAINFILALTSLLLFFPAAYFPLLKISLYHFENQINLYSTIYSLFAANYPFLGIVVALTTLIIPFAYSLLIAISFFLHKNNALTRMLLKMIKFLAHWHMAEVFLLGEIISIIKLISNFELAVGRGFYFFIALSISLLLTQSTFNYQQHWELLHE